MKITVESDEQTALRMANIIKTVFDVKKTKYGVDAYVTLETNQMNMLKMYLKNKSIQWDCNLNFVEI